jgi:hypothetical protein
MERPRRASLLDKTRALFARLRGKGEGEGGGEDLLLLPPPPPLSLDDALALVDAVDGRLADLANRPGGGFRREGIYRIPGSAADVETLVGSWVGGPDFPLLLPPDVPEETLASALKRSLFRLEVAVIPSSIRDEVLAAVRRDAEERAGGSPSLAAVLSSSLPPDHRRLLARLVRHLHRVAGSAEENRMPLSALATVFGPTVLRDDGIEEGEEPSGARAVSPFEAAAAVTAGNEALRVILERASDLGLLDDEEGQAHVQPLPPPLPPVSPPRLANSGGAGPGSSPSSSPSSSHSSSRPLPVPPPSHSPRRHGGATIPASLVTGAAAGGVWSSSAIRPLPATTASHLASHLAPDDAEGRATPLSVTPPVQGVGEEGDSSGAAGMTR